MKLSTAIRIGSMTTRQITRKLNDGNGGRCAIGAAAEAINVSFLDWAELGAFFPLANSRGSIELFNICAIPPCGPIILTHDIWVLNDRTPCTREEIADCVERFENYVANGNKHPEEKAIAVNLIKEEVTI